MNNWIAFVKNYASKNNMKYSEALKDPKVNALYKQSIATPKPKRGQGIMEDTTNLISHAVNKQVDKVINGMKYLVPPSLKDTLSKYANNTIIGATIYRHPVDEWIRKSLNILGSNKIPFDKLFHLRLLLKLDNGKDIFIEKNERLNSGIGMGPKKDGLETLSIDSGDLPHNLTFGQLVENTKQYQGDKFLTYSSSSNNCQYFLLAILQSNHFNNISKYSNFIKQNTESIFKQNPALRRLANTFTDLGAQVDVLRKGGNVILRPTGPHNNVFVHPGVPVNIRGRGTKNDTLGKFRNDLKVHMNEDSKEQREMNKTLKQMKDLDDKIYQLLK